MFQLKPEENKKKKPEETILQFYLKKNLLLFKKWRHPRADKDLKWTLFFRIIYIFRVLTDLQQI